MQSCCSLIASACPPIASASAVARRLRPLRAAPEPDCIASTAAPRLRPLPAALPDCARFSCCCTLAACVPFQLRSPIAPASAAAARSPLASASVAAPDRVRFGCCSLIVSASTAAPRLHASACSPSWIPAQCSRTFFVEFEVQ